MADKEEMIDKFVNITGITDKERAKFYLESSGWAIELAMASYYEEDQEDVDMTAPVPVPPSQPQATSSFKASDQKKSKATKNVGSSRFATIGNMRDDGESDSDSPDEGQAFYAGGSEHSGQQVLGPKKKKNVVENLFKSAREHGAEEVPSDEPKPKKGGKAFCGSGYRLGETEGEPTEVIQGASLMSKRKSVDCILKLWKDGFSVDDGPLRDFKDPANREFLDAISRGEVPNELIRAAKGGEVKLNMEDHREENYVKPKASLKAFTGEGHTLGSPVPAVVASSSSPSTQAKKTDTAAPASAINVDESKPTTSIQIRLADGTRVVGKFNHTHTVSDIRRHINSTRPQYDGTSYVLQTTFPNKVLTNDSETIEEAKLINAVVVQRLK